MTEEIINRDLYLTDLERQQANTSRSQNATV